MRILKYLFIIFIVCFSFYVSLQDRYLDKNFNKISFNNVDVYVDKDVNISNVVYVLDKSNEFISPNEVNGLKSIIFLEDDKQFRFTEKTHVLGWYNQEYKAAYIVYNLHKNNFELMHTFMHELAHHYDLTIQGNKMDGNQETRAENIVINKMF